MLLMVKCVLLGREEICERRESFHEMEMARQAG
jgi:hypothetical protein